MGKVATPVREPLCLANAVRDVSIQTVNLILKP